MGDNEIIQESLQPQCIKEEDKAYQSVKDIAKRLESITVKFIYAAGPDKRLYGSVTSKDIAEALKRDFGIDIDKRKIIMNENIKSFGTFAVDVKLYADVTGKINVLVAGKTE